MPTFEIETPQGTFEVEAPDQQTAIDALGRYATTDIEAAAQHYKMPSTAEQAARVRQGLSPAAPVFDPGVEGYNPETGNVDKMGGLGTFATSMAEGVPIIGPWLDSIVKSGGAALGSAVTDVPYDKARQQVDAMVDVGREENPVSRMAGNVAGATVALGPLAGTRAGGYALGVRGGGLGGRILRSGLSTGAINAADTAARGGDAIDATESGIIGAGIGAAFPPIGLGISKGLGAGADYFGSLIKSATKPAEMAEKRIGQAMTRDAGTVMSATDEATARMNNVPLTNVDRGGETVRALARSAANQSPETRAALDKVASDRFAGQSGRAAEFIRKLTGGNADDLTFQENLRNAARQMNKPAYDKAFDDPSAQAMWTRELADLMQAPAIQKAALGATTRGANRAVAEGFQPIRNPFMVKNGRLTFARDSNGTAIKPTLRFWDQVKRNLDSEIGKAQRGGDRTLAADLTQLKNQLVDTLDNAVPQYRTARRGAAAFFGAEDALEAGRKFATTPRAVPEAAKAFQGFSVAERKAFQTGYASELIDRIKASGDRMNVINSVFKSQSARESMQLVFGGQKMREIEAYVRVEGIVDRLRGAMGNSTTARQLVELGIGATGGYLYSGDAMGALTGAALVHGPRYLKGKIEQNVLREIGKILTANDAAQMRRIVNNAAHSPQYMKALEKLGKAIQVGGQAASPVTGKSLSANPQ